MLTVNIICIGKLKEKYFADAVDEYSKRLKRSCKFSVIELDEEKTPDNPNKSQIERTVYSEGERILAKISKGAYVIAMCIEGKEHSSRELAQIIEKLPLSSSNVDFIIGGSWGMSDKVKNRANLKLSMSPMTFPHQLARVMLCEQIYRAFQINQNTKYHK